MNVKIEKECDVFSLTAVRPTVTSDERKPTGDRSTPESGKKNSKYNHLNYLNIE